MGGVHTMTNLFISPHPDDETLFGAFTLIREKPLVVIVTDSWKQFNRGENIRADQRWEETIKAMQILGCSVIRLGIRDDIIDDWAVEEKLKRFSNFEVVYAPATTHNGNPHHELIGKVANKLFPNIKSYCTYTSNNLYPTGYVEIKPTLAEIDLKNIALDCYQSQINLPATKPHFDAVRGRSEWFI